jgi:hypothetical protein
LSVDIAEKVRVSWESEIDTVAPEPELEPLAGVEDEELLQAAAARHRASDTDVTTAPFLAIRIIKNHLASEKEVPHPGMRTCRRPGENYGLSVFNHDLRAPGINVALTSRSCREETVNNDHLCTTFDPRSSSGRYRWVHHSGASR